MEETAVDTGPPCAAAVAAVAAPAEAGMDAGTDTATGRAAAAGGSKAGPAECGGFLKEDEEAEAEAAAPGVSALGVQGEGAGRSGLNTGRPSNLLAKSTRCSTLKEEDAGV